MSRSGSDRWRSPVRHEFRPGRLLAGVVLMVTGVVYFGDAGGAWDTPWFVAIPLVVGGLCLAGAVGTVTHEVRRRRSSPGP
ncbi:hypothetical protein ABZ930_39540 [Streptomyces sp. NPDC046716]|uniref:hypothetical protein n=1 Tax=Streptomyces sp. NPDC046716 TaxID=3157093 RepID=UPI0033F53CEA